MKFDDTKKIFEDWKINIDNRLDEIFVSKLSEKSQDEDDVKDEKDEKVLFGEEESLEEISPVPTPIPDDEDQNIGEEKSLEETVRTKIREAIQKIFISEGARARRRSPLDASQNARESLEESLEKNKIKARFKKLLN